MSCSRFCVLRPFAAPCCSSKTPCARLKVQQCITLPPALFCHCRQQTKECTDDIKIFSRAIPFQHLGRETDVRVFIARTLEPGEVPPLTVPEVAAAWERKLQAAAAAQQPESIKAADRSAGPKVRVVAHSIG